MATKIYRYEITESEIESPAYAVGAHLVDRNQGNVGTWDFLGDDGLKRVVAKRYGEPLCWECSKTHKKATLWGHSGSHEDAPRITEDTP